MLEGTGFYRVRYSQELLIPYQQSDHTLLQSNVFNLVMIPGQRRNPDLCP